MIEFEAKDHARLPVVTGPDGHPIIMHWTRATEPAAGVKVGDILLTDRVTEETGTHVLIHNIRMEKLP